MAELFLSVLFLASGGYDGGISLRMYYRKLQNVMYNMEEGAGWVTLCGWEALHCYVSIFWKITHHDILDGLHFIFSEIIKKYECINEYL